MAWYSDLSPYSYYPGESDAVNVGWLEAGHPFQRGPVPLLVVAELERLSRDPKHPTRGYHQCQFCVPSTDTIAALPECLEAWWGQRRGNAEIHVQGTNGTTYIAPSLVLHYIIEHQYQPPREFIEAVLHQQHLRVERRGA